MIHTTNVLHPTDFSECSDFAFQTACELARASSGRVTVIHVVSPPTVIYGEGIVPPEPIDLLSAAEAAITRRQSPDPAVRVDHVVVEGDAVAEILWAAAANAYDLIVMGTHGRTGLSRFILGSVAEQVVRKAKCPVLTVKAPSAAPRKPVRDASPQQGERAPRGRTRMEDLVATVR